MKKAFIAVAVFITLGATLGVVVARSYLSSDYHRVRDVKIPSAKLAVSNDIKFTYGARESSGNSERITVNYEMSVEQFEEYTNYLIDVEDFVGTGYGPAGLVRDDVEARQSVQLDIEYSFGTGTIKIWVINY